MNIGQTTKHIWEREMVERFKKIRDIETPFTRKVFEEIYGKMSKATLESFIRRDFIIRIEDGIYKVKR